MCSSGRRQLTGTCEGDLSKVRTFQEFRPRRCLSSIHARQGPSHEGYLPFLNVATPWLQRYGFQKLQLPESSSAATGSAPTSLDLQGGHRGSSKSLAKATRLPAQSRSSREFIASRVTAAKKSLSKGKSPCSSGAAITGALICSVVPKSLVPKAFSGRIKGLYRGSSAPYHSHITCLSAVVINLAIYNPSVTLANSSEGSASNSNSQPVSSVFTLTSPIDTGVPGH